MSPLSFKVLATAAVVIGLSATAACDPTSFSEDIAGGLLETDDPGSILDFPEMGRMKASEIEVQVCSDHFAAGTPARREIDEAILNYSGLPGVALRFTTIERPHRAAVRLLPDDPRDGSIRIDYLDADDDPNDCKANSSVNGWVMSRCGFTNLGGWGTGSALSGLDAAAVIINTSRYCHDEDPNGDGPCSEHHPLEHGITHELGHAFGIPHSPYWPEDQKVFHSVSGAFQTSVTGRDLEFLQRKYPAETAPSWDFAVSGKVKEWQADGDWIGQNFEDRNAFTLYPDPDDGTLLDCKTGDLPQIKLAYFNLSSDDVPEDLPLPVELRLIDGAASIVAIRYESAFFPRNAQQSWEGPLLLTPADVSEIREPRSASLQLLLDPDGRFLERVEEGNNSISAPVTLVPAEADCDS